MKNQKYQFLFTLTGLLWGMNLFAQWAPFGGIFSSPSREISGISAVNENVIWCISLDNGFNDQFARTADGGESWEVGDITMDDLDNYLPIKIVAISDSIAWVIMDLFPNQESIRIYKTKDAGATWVEQTGEFNNPGHAFASMHFFNANEGLGFGSPGTGNNTIDSLQIFHTEDGGANWNRISPSALPAPLAGEGVWVNSFNNSYEAIGDSLWFVTRAGRVFRTIDKGNTWNAFKLDSIGFGFSQPSAIAFENSKIGLAVCIEPNKMYRTTDGGETWLKISAPSQPNFSAIEFIPGTKNTYLIHGGLINQTNKLLLTKDGGKTWKPVVYNPYVNCLQFLSPTIGFGGGKVDFLNNKGMYNWIGDLSDSLITQTAELASKPSLSINPNPFLAEISIKINSLVPIEKMQIYDIMGRVIISLNEVRNANNQTLDLSELASGLYFVKVKLKNGDSMIERILKQ